MLKALMITLFCLPVIAGEAPSKLFPEEDPPCEEVNASFIGTLEEFHNAVQLPLAAKDDETPKFETLALLDFRSFAGCYDKVDFSTCINTLTQYVDFAQDTIKSLSLYAFRFQEYPDLFVSFAENLKNLRNLENISFYKETLEGHDTEEYTALSDIEETNHMQQGSLPEDAESTIQSFLPLSAQCTIKGF